MEGLRHAVGNRIRDLRIARGTSLSELARESNVAKATLSNIEAGEANPTLDTLWSLSIALKVPLSSFFGEPQPGVKVIRSGDMKPVSGKALRGRLAAMFDVEASRIELFTGTLLKGVVQESPAHLRGVVEHVLVHRGRMKVGPRGQEMIVEAGDYLRMEADQPHSYEALTDDAFMTLVMQYPHEPESIRVLNAIGAAAADAP
ncbi:MAG: helix-turn-helix transcriptional regulator [Parvularculaceae bacterium]|nr:helix-turn-helix transcriptional regulator [Parvularculaceae bacterium]